MSKIGKFGAVLVVLVVLLPAIGAALSGATHVFSVENETVTVDYSNGSTVTQAGVAVSFYDNETVRNDSDDVLVEGTDYEWDTENGGIDWFDTASTASNESASISYSYDAPSERSRELSNVLQSGGYALALLTLLMAAGVVLGWLGMTPGGR